jgi:hypothetical protein|tara:strand:- start:1666 stop:2142 length:477 start_codon:yes stop_codon:yes gene_type:complete
MKIKDKIKKAYANVLTFKGRNRKTSKSIRVLTARASVLRYAHYSGYDTTAHSEYAATIAIALVSESAALCNRLVNLGRELKYVADNEELINIHRVILESTALSPSNLNIDHVGRLSLLEANSLAEAGFTAREFLVTDNSTHNPPGSLSEIFSTRQAVI